MNSKSIFSPAWAILLTIFLTVVAPFGAHAATQEDIRRISNELAVLSEVISETLGQNEMWIGGGSARSLVKSVVLGEPFDFRDLDIFISAEQEVTPELSERIGRALERRRMGKFSKIDLRPRPRANPNLPGEKGLQYIAGWGFFVVSQGMTHDISLYHSNVDVALNGLFDIDTIRVRIDSTERLTDFWKMEQAEFLSHIVDPHDALKMTLSGGQPRVVHWGNVAQDPLLQSIRVVRTLSKFGATPDEELNQQMRKLFSNGRTPNRLQVVRNLEKLLQDKDWLSELQLLTKWGFFDQVFSSGKSVVETKAKRLQTAVNESPPEERIVAFSKLLSETDRLNFAKFTSQYQPDLALKMLQGISTTKVRIGYFTGEFGPFHEGHLSVAEAALSSGLVDFVFIIPSPHVTNDPKTVRFSPKEWQERILFAQNATKAKLNIAVWPIGGSESRTLGEEIASLEGQFVGKAKITHIMGGDSLHRALQRNLPELDPRERIVVKRPGVTIPPEAKDVKGLHIIDNPLTAPVSATEILHTLAVDRSATVPLDPKVRDLVLATPRYQKIIGSLGEIRDRTDRSIVPIEDASRKTFILDPRQNNNGIWNENFPRYSEFYGQLINSLLSLSPKKVLIYIDSPDRLVLQSWRAGIRKLGLEGKVEALADYGNVPYKQRVMVLHSGLVNDALAKDFLSDRFRGEKGLIVFETKDRPTSTLVKELRNIQIISAAGRPIRGQPCAKYFLAN